ncbi:MAG: ABC transporter substrate-binding protein [Candidatus Binatia bacterium]
MLLWLWTRWVSAALLSGCVGVVCYESHTLSGEHAAPVFPPQRIVSLTLGTDEMLLALVARERIAALTYLADDPRYSNIVAEARAIAHKVRGNAELVFARQPDLILVAAYTPASAKDLLRQVGVPVVELGSYDSLASIERNILTVGQAVGEETQAQALVAAMWQRLSAVREQIGDAPRPRVVYYSPGGFIAGDQTIMHDVLTYAGARNAAVEIGIHSGKKISTETLVALNPAAILVSGEAQGVGLRDLLLADPTLQTIAAVERGAVYSLPRAYTSTVSHHIVRCAEAIARVLHPERFAVAREHSQ